MTKQAMPVRNRLSLSVREQEEEIQNVSVLDWLALVKPTQAGPQQATTNSTKGNSPIPTQAKTPPRRAM
jgi:hypothetical protein